MANFIEPMHRTDGKHLLNLQRVGQCYRFGLYTEPHDNADSENMPEVFIQLLLQ